MASMIEMFVTGVALDMNTNIPLVILNDSERKYTLPIWIGQFEAQSIARGLSSNEPARPMTHDLLVDVIDAMDSFVDSIEINAYEDQTFYASLILCDKSNKTYAIDSRPSDAISVAIRMEAPIYVSDEILSDLDSELKFLNDESQTVKEISEDEQEDFKDFLRNIKASDFTLDRTQD